jgi:hypothetical protein
VRREAILVAVGLMLAVVGLLFAALPEQWIESVLGVEPDGGNGAVEVLLAVVPLGTGAVMVSFGVRARVSGRRRRAGTESL